MAMEMALGMSEAAANNSGWRGTSQGTQMKSDEGWSIGNNGTNTSGFSGLPGGYRNTSGNFSTAGDNRGYWWSSSPDGSNAWNRLLDGNGEKVGRSRTNPRYGFSVRCIQDAE